MSSTRNEHSAREDRDHRDRTTRVRRDAPRGVRRLRRLGARARTSRSSRTSGSYALQHRGQEAAGIAVVRRPADRRLQGPRAGQPGLRRADALVAARPPRRRPHPLLHDGLHHLGERPADVPHHGDRQRPRAGAQRQPRQHRRAGARRRSRCAARATATARQPGSSASRRHHRLRPGRAGLLADAAADLGVEEAALRLLPDLRGAFCSSSATSTTLYAARDPHGVRPLVLGRLDRGWVVASETAALDIVGRVVRPRGRARRADRHRRRRPAQLAVRRAGAQGLRLRVRLPRPPGHHDLRPRRARGARRDRAPARRRAPGRGRPRDPGARSPGTPAAIGYAQGSGIPYGQGLVKNAYVGPHVHPALADHPPARHPAQAQPAARRHPRQAPRRRRRLDRPRQHPARARADAARGRRARGARPDRVAARALALLLRHRLRRRAPSSIANGLDDEGVRRSIGADTPRLHLAGRPHRGHRAAAHPAVHGLLRRRVPDPAARGGDARQAPARGRHRRELRRRRLGRTRRVRARRSNGAGMPLGRRDTVPRTRSAGP